MEFIQVRKQVRFINRLVLRFSIIGGIFNVLMAGTPMYLFYLMKSC